MATRLSMATSSEPDLGKSPEVSGILIALCCHHRCNWASFVGRDHFARMGFTSADFHLICHMSSWAVCGQRPPVKLQVGGDTGKSGHLEAMRDANSVEHGDSSLQPPKEESKNGSDNELENYVSDALLSVEASKPSLSQLPMEAPSGMVETHVKLKEKTTGYIAHPKESIGLQCKRLIDTARLMYLSEHGFNARLVYFVDRATSLENVLLIATPK